MEGYKIAVAVFACIAWTVAVIASLITVYEQEKRKKRHDN